MTWLDHLLAFPGCFAPDPAQAHSAIWLRTPATKSLATLVSVLLFATAVFAEAPELSTDKDTYAPNEPIEVTFRNSPGNSNDWIALATQATPDGQYQHWQWIRTTEGAVTFQGVDEGVYEVRIHLNGTHGEPAARHALRVDDALTEAEEPSPGSQVELGHRSAEPTSSSHDIPAGIWSAQFSCHLRGNAPEQFSAQLLTLDAHGDQAFFQLTGVDGPEELRPKYALLDAMDQGGYDGTKYNFAYSMLIDTRFDFVVRKISEDLLSVDFLYCEDVLFEREVAELVQPAFEGAWAGSLEACGSYNDGDALITLVKAHEGNFFADIDYKIYPQGRTGNSYPGRAYFYGNLNANSGGYAFSALARGRETRSGESGYLWGGLVGLELTYDADQEMLVGSSDDCSYAEFRREGEEASYGASEVSFGDSLKGLWEGEAICRDGDTFFALNITDGQSNRIAGVLDIAGPEAMMRGVSSLNVQLRESSRDEELEGAVEWAGATLRSFQISRGEHADTLTLAEGDLGCADVELSRVEAESLSRVPTVQVVDGGSFFESRRPEDRCEAIAELPRKFEAEFPDLPMRESRTERVYPKLVLLLADDDWVPVFGKPFDMTPLSERREIVLEAQQLCQNDPFYREDYSRFSMLDRALRGNFERPLTSFGLPAIHIAIRQIRETRHLLAQRIEETMAATEAQDAAAKARGTSAFMTNNRDRLWPSEIQAAEIRLSDHVAALAVHDVEGELSGALEASDPITRLAALRELADADEDYHRYLEERHMRDLQARITEQQSLIAQEFLSDEFTRIEALAHDETGLMQFENAVTEIDPTMTLLFDDVADPFKARIARKRQSILDALYARKIAALDSIAPGLVGLQGSLAWLEAFEALFAPYQNLVAFGGAKTEFVARRTSLLEGSLDQFERDVVEAAAEGDLEAIDKVVDQYLAWDGDEAISVWLEYQLIAESYK